MKTGRNHEWRQGWKHNWEHKRKPRHNRWTSALILALGLCGLVAASTQAAAKPGPKPGWKPVRFAVISDPHFYDTRLGESGVAFENYLNLDPKLLRESEAILDEALEKIVSENVRFLIIPGDLTKDGELVNHLRVAEKLAKLRLRGVQAYVIPGNHDLNNPDAKVFRGDTTVPATTVTPSQFRSIYSRFGYSQAISRDTASLSYVVQAAPGLWLLAIDSTDSGQNQELGYPRVGGHVLPQTMAWIQSRMQAAAQHGIRVIAFMHHGVNLNFLPQAQVFPDYLVDDWPMIGAQLNAVGLKVIFTGHYHTQDAAFPVDANGNSVPGLLDVETGSLVGYPCAFRIASLDAARQNLSIESRHVTTFRGYDRDVPFQTYAEDFVRARLPMLVTYQLMQQFGLPQADAAALAPLVVDALVAQYVGDESPSLETQATLNAFVGMPEPMHTLGLLLWGLWLDIPPGDNTLQVSLAEN